MTHCPNCKNHDTIDHPRYKYHVAVICKLTGEAFDEDNKAPIACREYIEEPKVVRAYNYILNNWHSNPVLDSHGKWHEEMIRDGR